MTILYAARDQEHNNGVVLAELLAQLPSTVRVDGPHARGGRKKLSADDANIG